MQLITSGSTRRLITPVNVGECKRNLKFVSINLPVRHSQNSSAYGAIDGYDRCPITSMKIKIT